jgi:TolB-like protein
MRRIAMMVVLCVGFAVPWAAADTPTVAILPFEVHSSEDLGYLQRGITQMLSSRVARGGVKVVDSAAISSLGEGAAAGLDAAQAAALGAKLKADFVVFGSITKLGKHISLDGAVVDVAQAASRSRLFAEAPDMDGVIPQMGRLAEEIRRSLTGASAPPAQTASSQAARPVQQQAVPPGAGQSALPQQQIVAGAAAPVYQPPPGGYPVPPGGFTGREQGDLFTGAEAPQQIGAGEGSLNPGFIMSYQADKARRGYVKTPELQVKEIQAISVGDTDGDGLPETVVADPDRIYIYENVLVDPSQRTIITPSATLAKVLSLDVADVNGNGVAEIYVTAVQANHEIVSSQVLEYQQGTYRSLAEDIPYFLRVTRSMREGLVLVGQEKRRRYLLDRINDPLISPFLEPFRLHWQDGKLVKGDKLPLDANVSVLGLTMVDVDHDGVDEYLTFDTSDYLKLFNARGGMVWVSQEPYGRTANYFLKDLGRQIGPNEDAPEMRVWLPPRIVTVDLDNDGSEEVILCHNYEPIRLLSQSRLFTKSAVFSLSWDGVDFMENWRTREMKGYVADYQVRDVDGNGQPELLVGLIYKRGTKDFIRTDSTLISFDLRLSEYRKSATKGEGKAQPSGIVKPGPS